MVRGSDWTKTRGRLYRFTLLKRPRLMSDPIIDPAHAIPAASALRRSRFRWRILAFVALVIAILAGVGRFATETGLSGDQIARVVIDGTIATDPNRLRVLDALGKDDSVKAVMLAINSPGGTTAGGEELYESLGKLRAKKPVVAVHQRARRVGRLYDGDRRRTASSRGGCRSSARSACCSRPTMPASCSTPSASAPTRSPRVRSRPSPTSIIR